MKSQSKSTLVDVWDLAQTDCVLRIGAFEEVFSALYLMHGKLLDQFLQGIHMEINDIWKDKVTDERMHQQWRVLCEQCKTSKVYQDLHAAYDKSVPVTPNYKWRTFIYCVMKALYDNYVRKIKTKLIAMAMKDAEAIVSRSTAFSNDEQYLVYSMAGSACNSLLRRYFGYNFSRSNKVYLVTTVYAMLFRYKNLEEFRAKKGIPKRLYIENRGGLRIILPQFAELAKEIIVFLTPKMHNMVLIYGGKLKPILDDVLQKFQDYSFAALFDMQCLKERTTHYLSRGVQSKSDKIEMDAECEECKVDCDLLARSIQRVKADFITSTVSRCLWSYIKRIKPETKHTLSLRSKLQIFHMSADKKQSSLQVETI